MTVTYTQKVSDCKGFGSFWRLLFRWRGSLYKLVWPDTIVYSFLYFICSIVYRFGLDEKQRRVFEHLSLYCDYFRNLIPISFVLGFYVTVVVHRWWEQYLSIPWPDDFALLCTAYIRGRSGAGRAIRATMLRYVNLTCVLTFAKISPKVHKKFPSYKEMLEAGYLTPHEKRILEEQGTRSSVSLATLPLMWSCKVVEGARSSRHIADDFGPKMLVQELVKLRDKAGMLLRWTELSIPLVYTQVVTMAVYSFFLFSVLGRQFLDPAQKYSNRTIDFFVPIFTLLQFFFYMGWLKVAESLVNPFGEDDDDFDLDLILERHFKMSYLLGGVTPSEDPLDVDEFTWDKFCPGSYTGPGSDLSLGRDLGHMADQGRMADLGSSDLGRSTPDPDTVILSPDPPQRNQLDFIWEQMDLSVPREPVKGTTTYSSLQIDSNGRSEDAEEGHGNLGHGNQGHGNQGHGNQGHGNQGHGNQGHGNVSSRPTYLGLNPSLTNLGRNSPCNSGHISPGHTSLGHTNAGYISPGHISPGHINAGRISPGHANSGHISPGHLNADRISPGHLTAGRISPGLLTAGRISPGHLTAGRISPGHPNGGHISPGHSSLGYSTSGYSSLGHANQGHANQGHTKQGHSSLGHTRQRTSNNREKNDNAVEGVLNPALMD